MEDLGDFGVLVDDFLLLGDLIDFLADFEPLPEGVFGDFRDFLAEVDDLLLDDDVSRDVGRAFFRGDPELKASVAKETDEPEGDINDSRLA